ncbi:hypothetical protein N0V90_009168 [Kalmusia sp. IMI 367209]|nr:hypothetical protein N0V90_009168 [Kalmusia sp. IMI 367209]
MADHPSRTLLTPPSRSTKSQSISKGQRTRYKLPCITFSLVATLIGCITASIVILLTSHEDPVQVWRIRPAIWLSILAGVYAIALGGLFSIGVAVIWWRSIAHGTTIERLHFVHAGASPQDILPAFLAGAHARRVAVAALTVFAAKLAIGPMLQRSTRPMTHEAKRNIQMNIELAPEIPEEWFGTQDLFSNNGIWTSQTNFFGANITTENSTTHICPSYGTCKAEVIAAGLNLWNKTESKSLNLLDPANVNETLFSINLALNYDNDLSVLYLDTQFISAVDNNCIATVTQETYAMIPATMAYTIFIQDNRITPDIFGIIDNPVIVANSTSLSSNGTEGLWKGILEAFAPIYVSKAVLRSPKDGKFAKYGLASDDNLNSFWADMYLNTGVGPESDYPENVIKYCPLIWDSPTKYVLQQILEYIFRASRAVAASRDEARDEQSFIAVYRGEELWYVTDFRWLFGSVAVMALGSAAALSLLWGWWQLDRYVTLSPLETGKALGAPILAGAGPEQEVDSILKDVGHELVAYDGEELVWAGSLYATGVGGSLRTKASQNFDESRYEYVAPEILESDHLNAQRHRRGVRSINGADPIRVTRAFEHDIGYTTRKPYEDEEEMDIGQYGRPWTTDDRNNHVPLIQMLSNIAAPRSMPLYEQVSQPSPVPSPTAMQYSEKYNA